MKGMFAARPNIGLFGGVSSTTLVPGQYPVALGGHAYLLDNGQHDAHNHATVPDLNPRAYGFSASDEVSERTLNPDAAWRRSQESWHGGAGQRHLDAAGSDRTRFWTSKGIDVWTKWQIQLLPATVRRKVTTETNLAVLPVGDHLYVLDGLDLYHSTDVQTWTAANINTGASAVRGTSICSDGYRVFAAMGANGIRLTNRGDVTGSAYNALTPTVIDWVKGRLMAAQGTGIYYVSASGAAPAALFNHPNPDWAWVGFTEGDSAIYAAGFSGDKSEIYRVGIKSDGSGLDVPIIAARLPDGETVTGIGSYLGFVFLGTTKGVRMCSPITNGDLRLGPVISTTGSVRCFEGQDRFLWFGWENYDAAATGLGRLDPTVLNDVAPAYATDLMATDTGRVTSVVTFNGVRVLTVAGSGVWQQSPATVTTGTLDTGLITFGISDPKIALVMAARHEQPISGDHHVLLTDDTTNPTDLGSIIGGNLSAQERRSEAFELQHVLTSDGFDGPVLKSWTFRILPAPPTTERLQVPLLLSQYDNLPDQSTVARDVVKELAYLKGLRDSRSVFAYQEGTVSTSVTMSDYHWMPRNPTDDNLGWNGTFVAVLTTVSTA